MRGDFAFAALGDLFGCGDLVVWGERVFCGERIFLEDREERYAGDGTDRMLPTVRAAAAGEDADGVRAVAKGGLGGGRGVEAGVDMMGLSKTIEGVKTVREVS